MEAASTAPPRERDCRGLRLTPASEHSYPCAVMSNLKLGHLAFQLRTLASEKIIGGDSYAR